MTHGPTYNEFNREMQKRIQDPQMRYVFMTMFEILVQQSNDIDNLAKLVVNLAEQQQKFAEFNKAMQADIEAVKRRGVPEGVDIHTETVYDAPKD